MSTKPLITGLKVSLLRANGRARRPPSRRRCFVKLLLSSALILPLLSTIRAESQDWLPPAPGAITVIQLTGKDRLHRNYPEALPSLLRELNRVTSAQFDSQPLMINAFDDPALKRNALLYVNFDDRGEWELSEREKQGLKEFLERGGFLLIDAGVKTEFLRNRTAYGQGHSYAEWEVRPEVARIFQEIFPEEIFRPLPRDHEIFRIYKQGLPDPALLPEAIRDYIVNEKWPGGTYSLLGLFVNKRLAAIATPIIAFGWAKDESGNWINPISFRVLESGDELEKRLSVAAYSGGKYEAVREDGLKDVIYTQNDAQPAWVEEPGGRWRIFRFYQGKEISDYAHEFYTQLGVNIFVHALCN